MAIRNSVSRLTSDPDTGASTGLDGAIPRIVLAFAVSIALAMVLAPLMYFLNSETDLFKLGYEGSVPTWLSSVQLFLIAGVLAPLATRDLDINRVRTWAIGLVPLFFVLLSLDEVAKLHERLGEGFLPLVAVVAGVVAVKMWPYVRHRHQAMLLMVWGVAILGGSAVGLEIAAKFVIDDSTVQRALAFAEESGELIGANLILWGSLVVARCEGTRRDLG